MNYIASEEKEIERHKEADRFIVQTGAHIRMRSDCDCAAYHTGEHRIIIPLIKRFISQKDLYSVLFHELTHWSSKGVGRQIETPIPNMFNAHKTIPKIVQEEITADFGSAFLLDQFGLLGDVERHATYINHFKRQDDWQGGNVEIAAEDASKAVAYLNHIVNQKKVA